jgi:hypothetical protein
MRKLGIIAVLSLMALALAAVPALAQVQGSPHFKGRSGAPVCTITTATGTSSTECTASLSGLSNEDLVIETTVSGSAVYNCQNQGGNIAPGQNRVLVGPTTAPTIIPGDELKNGNVTFTTDPAVLTAPETVTGAEAGCPNRTWTGVNPTLTTTNIDMTISQGGELLFTCTAENTAGLSGRVPLTCTQEF